jgi:Tfp pilus assembly protein PilF
MISVSNKQRSLVLLFFMSVGFLAYSNTFDVPFHFDDSHVVSDLSFEEMLEKFKGGGSRVVAHMTFLFNYWIGGTYVFGYHVFNTFIHVGAAFFVYTFLTLVLSVSNSDPDKSSQDTNQVLPPLSDAVFWPAFLGSTLFLVHPIATQAVTYITQRYTSLAGFFYIGSLAFFVSARLKYKHGEPFQKGPHLARYICSFVMAVLAMRTKEMAITLPVAILLTEYYFIQSDLRASARRLLYLLPLLSTCLIIPVFNIIGVKTINLETLSTLQDYTWGQGISRLEYLFTQFKIIVGIYLKLLVLPIGQNIDHDYVISKTFFDLTTIVSFLALCVIVSIALRLFRGAKLVSFGILWFFVTIIPTSSIVPNTEFVAEHRAYISLMGLAFAVSGMPKWQHRWKRYILLLLPILLVFSGLTYARNKVWQTDLSLWEDSATKSVNRPRPHNNLAVAMTQRGNLDGAINQLYKALNIDPYYADAHNNLGDALLKQGRLEEATGHLTEALRIKPDYADALNNLGNAMLNQGKVNEAIGHFTKALQIKPHFAQPHNNLGVLMVRQGRLDKATGHLFEALRIKPDYADAHNNLGVVLANQERIEEAINHFSAALRIKPDYADARSNLQTFSQQIAATGETGD